MSETATLSPTLHEDETDEIEIAESSTPTVDVGGQRTATEKAVVGKVLNLGYRKRHLRRPRRDATEGAKATKPAALAKAAVQAKVAAQTKSAAFARDAEQVKNAEQAKAPAVAKNAEQAKAAAVAKAPEQAKAPAVAKAPEQAKAPAVAKAPEQAKAPAQAESAALVKDLAQTKSAAQAKPAVQTKSAVQTMPTAQTKSAVQTMPTAQTPAASTAQPPAQTMPTAQTKSAAQTLPTGQANTVKQAASIPRAKIISRGSGRLGSLVAWPWTILLRSLRLSCRLVYGLVKSTLWTIPSFAFRQITASKLRLITATLMIGTTAYFVAPKLVTLSEMGYDVWSSPETAAQSGQDAVPEIQSMEPPETNTKTPPAVQPVTEVCEFLARPAARLFIDGKLVSDEIPPIYRAELTLGEHAIQFVSTTNRTNELQINVVEGTPTRWFMNWIDNEVSERSLRP